MALVAYEFSGSKFDTGDAEALTASVGRDFYSADLDVIRQGPELFLQNTRALAGYIPITTHRTSGLKTVTRRSSAQVRSSSSDIYLLWVPVHGSVTITQNGHSTVVEPGSVALSASSEPLCIGTLPNEQDEHLSYQIVVPAHLVSRRLNDPKRLCAMPFSARQGGPRIASDLLMALYREADFMDRSLAEELALSALELIFKTMSQEGAEHCQSVGVKEVKLQRLLDYIELHYSDPDLTTEKVARACGISTRYLHYLLKSTGKRFNDSVWQARLNSAYEQLVDPSLTRRTVAQIAFGAGFKSSAHFSRAFRERFGCSPKEVREGLRPAAANESLPS